MNKAIVHLPTSIQHNKRVEEDADIVVERMEKGCLPDGYNIYREVTEIILRHPFDTGISWIENVLPRNIEQYREQSEDKDYFRIYPVWYDPSDMDYWTDTRLEDFPLWRDGYNTDY